MTIQWFRDLVIIILGIIAVGAFIFWIVLSSLLYKRLNRILHSVERTTAAIQAMTSFITEEVVKPLVKVATIIQGVRQGIDSITSMFQKGQNKEGEQ